MTARSHKIQICRLREVTELCSKTDQQKIKGKSSITTKQPINGSGIASGSITTVLQKQSLSQTSP